MTDHQQGRGPAGDWLTLQPIDLLLDLAALLFLLPETIQRGEWLDAYLLGAAADQILEDGESGRRQPGGRAWWRRVARELQRGPRLDAAGRAVGATVSVSDRVLELTPRSRRVAGLHEQLAAVKDRLADLVVDPAAPVDTAALVCWARTVLEDSKRLPSSLRREPLRLPSSFRSFDQHPADIRELAQRFSTLWPRRSTPVVTVGIRTSGCYLAPLAAAGLRHLGYRRVHSVTVRPLVGPGRQERRLLAEAAAGGHLIAVLDDPPVSGRSIRKVTDQLESMGVQPENIILLLALQTGTGELPEPLRRYPSVLLPWPEWHVHRSLAPDRVAATLGGMLAPGTEVVGVRRRDPVSGPGRKHVRAFYVADVKERAGTARSIDVAVEGAGLGFFGRHIVAVADALGAAVPRVYGFHDGLVYRQWVHGPTARLSMAEPAIYSQIADYTARRHEVLTVGRDRSRHLAGDQPVWEVASQILGGSFGRAGTFLRPFLVDPLARRVLAVEQPSVVDGLMDADRWHRNSGDSLVKVDFAARAFSNLDLTCYDPVFDLAGAAVEIEKEPGGSDAVAEIRRRFEEKTGLLVDEERWLLYQLVHLWDDERVGRCSRPESQTARSRAVLRYFARLYLADLPRPGAGPLCALDLDGVLESSPLGFSAPTEAGAMALRALRAHGYRVAIATGRSLGEVMDRCRILGLAGGVAEYGAVVYDSQRERIVELVSAQDMEATEAARATLAGCSGLETDSRFHYVVRVRSNRPGRRGSVSPLSLGTLPEPAGGPWQYVVGEGQTDVVPPNVDKGRGLQVLAARLNPPAGSSDRTVELAVGDTGADLPMLELARLAYGPANSSQTLSRAGIPILRHSYQRALAEAVGELIGHPPGGCARCAVPAPSLNRRLLLQALSIQEDGGKGMSWRTARLAADLITTGVRS